MKVSANRAVSPAKSKTRARSAPGDARFTLDAVDRVATPAAAAKPQAVGAVGALLALQEMSSTPDSLRQRSLKRADQMMDTLEQLRLGLLTGRLDGSLQSRLRSLLAEKQAESDEIEPELEDLLRDIETRAAVELEKLAQSQKRDI